MATFLLGTGVIIDALNDKRSRSSLLLELLQAGHVLACCPINVAEVYAGLRPPEENKTETFLESLEYYPITLPVARLAGLLKRDCAKKGITLNLGDVIIAAVALHFQLPFITDNTRDFPMKELQLYPLPKK